jgi:hypothetical protein
MSTIDPDQSGGFTGNGASWFRATGEIAYAPDGSVAWEYRDAFSSESIWANSLASLQLRSPDPGLIIPSFPQRLVLIPNVADNFELLPTPFDPSNLIPAIQVQWDTPQRINVPEPSTFAITGLILLLLVIIAHRVILPSCRTTGRQ